MFLDGARAPHAFGNRQGDPTKIARILGDIFTESRGIHRGNACGQSCSFPNLSVDPTKGYGHAAARTRARLTFLFFKLYT